MTVYAFEPNAANAGILRRNAELNALRINPFECALGSSNGRARISQSGATSRITRDEGVEVEMCTLDSFDLPSLDLLKIDVEGCELEVLQGARETLERAHPTMMVEMHHWIGAENEATFFEILWGLDYRFEYLDRYSQGRHLIATHASDH